MYSIFRSSTLPRLPHVENKCFSILRTIPNKNTTADNNPVILADLITKTYLNNNHTFYIYVFVTAKIAYLQHDLKTCLSSIYLQISEYDKNIYI